VYVPGLIGFGQAFTTLNWAYKTVPQDHLGGRNITINAGKALGGGSISTSSPLISCSFFFFQRNFVSCLVNSMIFVCSTCAADVSYVDKVLPLASSRKGAIRRLGRAQQQRPELDMGFSLPLFQEIGNPHPAKRIPARCRREIHSRSSRDIRSRRTRPRRVSKLLLPTIKDVAHRVGVRTFARSLCRTSSRRSGDFHQFSRREEQYPVSCGSRFAHLDDTRLMTVQILIQCIIITITQVFFRLRVLHAFRGPS